MPRKVREVPWLDQRDGVYYAFWYNKETRRTDRFSLRTSDPGEATEAFAVFLTDGRAIHKRISTQPTVKEVLDFYVKERGPAMAARWRQEIAAENVARHIGGYRIGSVDGAVCREYAKARRKEPSNTQTPKKHRVAPVNFIRNATINRELGVLKAAAMFGVNHKFVGRGDLPIVLKEEDDTRKRRALTREELQQALSEVPDQDMYDYLMVLYYTGARRRAVERLTPAQVDFEHMVIEQMVPGERKTKKRRPPIPLQPEIREILMRRFNSDPKRLFKPHMAIRVKHYLKSLGIEDAAMAHVLRHTRATMLLRDGVPIFTVAQLLGDTVETIESTYAHILVKDLTTNGGRL